MGQRTNMNNQKIMQIAASVNLMAQLPNGNALVQVLGYGNESSNLEALSHWIESQEDLLTIQKPVFLVEQLLFRLHSTLEELYCSHSF